MAGHASEAKREGFPSGPAFMDPPTHHSRQCVLLTSFVTASCPDPAPREGPEPRLLADDGACAPCEMPSKCSLCYRYRGWSCPWPSSQPGPCKSRGAPKVNRD